MWQWRRKAADTTRENSNQWEACTPPNAIQQAFNEYRKIARLVKAKEEVKPKEYAEIQSKQIENPTDTKEGIQVEKSGKEIKLYSDENQAVITSMFINGEEWVKKPKETESHDDLWVEFLRLTFSQKRDTTQESGVYFDINEAKARFRIERI